MLKYNNPQTGIEGDGAHFKENEKFKRALPTHFKWNQTNRFPSYKHSELPDIVM